MEEKLKKHITQVLTELGITEVPVSLEHPAELVHGDYATNVAMVAAKKAGKNPHLLAEDLASRLRLDMKADPDIAAIETAGPGFINFRLSQKYFVTALHEALALGDEFGANRALAGKKVMIEYTDPNPFKEFHIGHLLPNTIGESLSRIVEFSAADIRRVNYQGDVGLHVASALFGMQHMVLPGNDASIIERARFLGRAYAHGATAAKEDESVKQEIAAINKKVYDQSDNELNRLYALGKSWSLEYFEVIYATLGTKFDHYFFESEAGHFGKLLVLQNTGELEQKAFEESSGAVIFPGEKYDPSLHTRVFINSDGLPTYEAKELGLAKIKYQYFPYDLSIVVTANEIVDYFKVLLRAMRLVYPDLGLAQKTKHIAHGMLRLSSGKMSSRTGNVITALSLIEEAETVLAAKITNERGFSDNERKEITEKVAIGAIKYSILRQQIGHDMIFDFQQSLSFEGDSGPYLQYTFARSASLLEKAGARAIDPRALLGDVPALHKQLIRFPEVVDRAREEYAPHLIANHLILLAREFNAFYGNTPILNGSSDEAYKLALVSLVSQILKRGLWLLGIAAPAKM